ncbi:MAG: invasin domain 3-containing protein [Desulfosalsimonadaceae bacterium]
MRFQYAGRTMWMIFVVILMAFLLVSCGSSGSHGDDDEESTVEVSTIALVAARDSVKPDEQTTVTAMVYDESGHGIGGRKIEFKLDDPTLGSITNEGRTQSDGTFEASFQARSGTGTVQITAMAGSATSEAKEIIITDQLVENLSLSASPTTIIVEKTSTITAEVTDENGDPVANGTTVNFSLEDDAFGSITEEASTNAGKAKATFTAANYGTATINAECGTASNSVNVTVEPAQAASIEFDSVSQNPIAIKGTGGQEFGNVAFNVKDVNGNPAKDVDVLFTMVSGVQGEEYLEEDDPTPYTQTVSTSEGTAEVTIHSGYEAGAVSVKASITTAEGNTISATTPVISIGGGVPNDEWFTVAVDESPGWNMGGLACVGVETEITAWLADRFGNYNVLDGHNVFFESEVGLAVYPTATTEGENGSATSTIRTQSANGGAPKDVVPELWETDLKEDIADDFDNGVGDPLPSGHPRDGVCNVLIFTNGEEAFVDGSNGNEVNGLYDAGEEFTDTADDPWRDYDDDGKWDDGTETTPLTVIGGANPEEDAYQDRAGNNKWDGKNAVWDGPHPSEGYSTKNLFRQVDFLITGLPIIRIDKGSFNVPNGGQDTVKILICDENYNPLATDSTYKIEVDVGKITGGTKDYTYPSSNFYGSETNTDMDADGDIDSDDYMLAHRSLIVNEITISDDNPQEDQAEQAELSVNVVWTSNGGCADQEQSFSITGTVH